MKISLYQATVGISRRKQSPSHQQFPSDESSSNMEVVYLLVWRTGKFSCSFNCELTQKSHPFLKPFSLLLALEERVQDSEDAEADAARLESSIAQALLWRQPGRPSPSPALDV